MARQRGQQTKKTHEQRVLEALKESLLRLATQDEAEIQIHGRTVKFRDPEKVQALIDRYQAIVNQQQGISPITMIPVRLLR